MLPTLVLLPGMDGTGELFALFCAALGDDIETIRVRYPTNEMLGYGELTAVARSWLPGDKPFVLLAESFSGPVAVLLAATKPTGLVGLILCASFVRNPRPAFGPLTSVLQSFWSNGIPKRLLHSLLLGGSATKDVRDDLDRVLKNVEKRVLFHRLRSIADVDVRQQLDRIEIPGMYLRATNDRLVPPASSRPFESLTPRWAIREIAAPHFVLQVAPRSAAREVREFVESIAPRVR